MCHDGRANTYSFNYKGVKIILVPNRVPAESKPMKQGAVTSMLSQAKFEEELQDLDIVFALVGKEVSEGVVIPEVAASLVREF